MLNAKRFSRTNRNSHNEWIERMHLALTRFPLPSKKVRASTTSVSRTVLERDDTSSVSNHFAWLNDVDLLNGDDPCMIECYSVMVTVQGESHFQ